MTHHVGPDAEAAETVGGVILDLARIAGRLRARTGDAEPVAQLLDRLATEITEAAAMLRAARNRHLRPETLSRPGP